MTKFESKFNYDERTKELTASKVWTMKGEKEVKDLLKTFNTQKTGFQQSIKQAKEGLKTKPKMTKELLHLKELLTNLQKIDMAEKLEGQLKDAEANLKSVSEEITKLKQEIGTRLKL